MWQFGSLEVGGVTGGTTGSAHKSFNYIVQNKKTKWENSPVRLAMDLILVLAAGLFICEDAAMGRCGGLEVGRVMGGRAGLVAMIFN